MRAPTLLYACTLGLSAFLLFWVQLLCGRLLLPLLGGAPAVWTTSLFFFQGVLLAGYAYAQASRLGHPSEQVLRQRMRGAQQLMQVRAEPHGGRVIPPEGVTAVRERQDQDRIDNEKARRELRSYMEVSYTHLDHRVKVLEGR